MRCVHAKFQWTTGTENRTTRHEEDSRLALWTLLLTEGFTDLCDGWIDTSGNEWFFRYLNKSLINHHRTLWLFICTTTERESVSMLRQLHESSNRNGLKPNYLFQFTWHRFIGKASRKHVKRFAAHPIHRRNQQRSENEKIYSLVNKTLIAV